MEDYYSRCGQIWANVKTGKLIGSGSYGTVWEILESDESGNMKKISGEVVKEVLIPPESAGGMDEAVLQGLDFRGAKHYFESLKQRAIDEVTMMQSLSSCVNIVQIKDYSIKELCESDREIGWVVFIRMERLQPLKEKLISEGITAKELKKLGIDICNALIACEKKGVIHRDVKPENLYYSQEEDLFKLGDFGISCFISRPSEGKGLPGTLTHMSPEIFHGHPFTPAGDLYALGMILYRLLNDNRIPFLPIYPVPFTHSDRDHALGVRLDGTVVPPPSIIYLPDDACHPTLTVEPDSISTLKKLGKISMRAISANTEDRYATATELKEALESV